ncbi:MAG: Holliday junction DNA helicase RuvA [Candidatus Magasanikbacteria bacterium RIFCSPHIGHO2_02_FULL_41_13]|uniref:Holliday junction branch migration complex subunit RuvA n=1 Tax=Candidatus Magasanikbacteria bacterium RIFCSPHIGHO2_02_FULL_41_13 TaxID=1798676 RepID=A0A1F6M434_9BACT|nr:MAG: Holliday junction DNA helicase RuvA [Candidatus Magasanikbacteria bacterium RIFCSPHIGHO2_02_FULL_41_13]
MIGLLSGKIFEKSKDSVLVETSGGVGYLVRMTTSSVAGCHVGQDIKMYTYLKVSDSALDLYGFQNLEEKDFFELLMTVSGVGPKSAMNILSLGHREEIQSAIARSDVKYLTGVQGMGKKTAERLVVELKNKVIASASDVHSTNTGESAILTDVLEGLMALGYSRDEAKGLVKNIETEGKTAEQILKLALKK